SWSLYASQRVGGSGRVLAIDLKEISQNFPRNVTVVQGDAFDVDSETLGQFAPYDVVLSDMAPKTSGVRLRDQAMSYELFERALEVGFTLGTKGSSSLVCKILMGPDFDQAVALAKKYYAKTRIIRPAGVRSNSKEVFLVGLGLREEVPD
ncbi:MAG: RlmE family RNA methyltransferase, partial [Polyangiaceae bacterium]|nr:RlmE family RNA methyltransferase [Polyangiaceae bacterium]